MDAPFPKGMVEWIEGFLSDDKNRRPGRDVYPEVFNSPLFFPLQRMRETEQMMKMAYSIRPKVVMEIGADKGGGLYHWCKSLRTVERVIACEIRGTPYKKSFQRAFPKIDFLWVEGSSYDPDNVSQVATWLSNSESLQHTIDCLFIDGDKLRFVDDFDCYRPFLSSPSLVFLHDIQDREPREAFRTLADRGLRTTTILDTSESAEALERERQGYPARTIYEGWLRHWKGRSCGVGVVHVE